MKRIDIETWGLPILIMVVLTAMFISVGPKLTQIKISDHPITVYTPIEILYIYPLYNIVEFESGKDSREFGSYKELTLYVEKLTALHSNKIISYLEKKDSIILQQHEELKSQRSELSSYRFWENIKKVNAAPYN